LIAREYLGQRKRQFHRWCGVAGFSKSRLSSRFLNVVFVNRRLNTKISQNGTRFLPGNPNNANDAATAGMKSFCVYILNQSSLHEEFRTYLLTIPELKLSVNLCCSAALYSADRTAYESSSEASVGQFFLVCFFCHCLMMMMMMMGDFFVDARALR